MQVFTPRPGGTNLSVEMITKSRWGGLVVRVFDVGRVS